MAFNKDSVRSIIFEADTPAGKAFDVWLIVLILLSVAAIMADSVGGIHDRYGTALYVAEWIFTILFTIEYGLRLWCIQNTALYARSFYGIVDLLCILPTYLSLWIAGTQYFLVIRVLRVLRVFRVLRMVRYVGEAEMLAEALSASRRKVVVFITSVFALAVIAGSIMYLVEGGSNANFRSIPDSIYWAVSTMTTVGYGDIAPRAVSAGVSPRGHADGLRHHRRADGHRDARTQRGQPSTRQHPHLSRVLCRRTLAAGRVLLALWRAAGAPRAARRDARATQGRAGAGQIDLGWDPGFRQNTPPDFRRRLNL